MIVLTRDELEVVGGCIRRDVWRHAYDREAHRWVNEGGSMIDERAPKLTPILDRLVNVGVLHLRQTSGREEYYDTTEAYLQGDI